MKTQFVSSLSLAVTEQPSNAMQVNREGLGPQFWGMEPTMVGQQLWLGEWEAVGPMVSPLRNPEDES